MSGWVKLHRSVLEHWVFGDAELFRIWAEVLLRASHKERKMIFNGELVVAPRGSLVVSKIKWAERLGLSRPRLDRALGKLECDGMIVQQTSKRRTVISVVNYEAYQSRDEPKGAGGAIGDATGRATEVTTGVQPSSNGRAIAGQPSCTNKKENNLKIEQEGREGAKRAAHVLESHFVPMAEEGEWRANPQHERLGRRPLKKYPDLFLTPDELAAVFDQLSAAGIPADQYRLVFMRVAARLMTHRADGRDLASVSAFNWLTGWAKSEVLKELADACHLERSREYLARTRI